MAEKPVPDELAALGLEEVRVVRLEPGDVIVLRVPNRLTDEEYGEIRDQAATFFGDHKVAVLEGGMALDVLREGDGSGRVELEWTASPDDELVGWLRKNIRGRWSK